MGQVNGTFIYEGEPRNGATAKLWEADGFASAPELDDDEPAGGYQQGSNVTTGTAHGGNGAYRWTSVPVGEYYVSCEYQSHRVFQYYYVESITTLLTAEGDLLVRGATVLERLAKGSNGQILEIVSGVPAWAALSLTVTVHGSAEAQEPTPDGAWHDVISCSVPAAAKSVIIHGSFYEYGLNVGYSIQGLYNAVQKFVEVLDNQQQVEFGQWSGDGLGSEETAVVQHKLEEGGETRSSAAGIIYGIA